MVVDVAEVLAQVGADLERRALGDRRRGAEQRVHRAVEVRDLAPQQVDPARRRGRAGEDHVLDLLDVALEALDHRRVVVDDLVRDGPQHRGRTLVEQRRALLEPQPRAVQVGATPWRTVMMKPGPRKIETSPNSTSSRSST